MAVEVADAARSEIQIAPHRRGHGAMRLGQVPSGNPEGAAPELDTVEAARELDERAVATLADGRDDATDARLDTPVGGRAA